jgi:hypothetical protein
MTPTDKKMRSTFILINMIAQLSRLMKKKKEKKKKTRSGRSFILSQIA